MAHHCGIAHGSLVRSAGRHCARRAPDSALKSGAADCARPDFRVVLDVGHTAKSPGAKSARGADEFDFNLRLAKQIDQALLEAGFAKTVLMVSEGRHVRFGSKADVCSALAYVRFTPESDIKCDIWNVRYGLSS